MNLKELRELIELIQKSGIAELELEKSGVRVKIKREHAPVPGAPAPPVPPPPSAEAALPRPVSAEAQPPASPATAEEALRAGLMTLTSPVVGTFYRAPAPDADPYVEVGALVKKGQIICVIEAMKLMNEIESEWDGKIIELLVENAQPVEYGAPLFRIEPLPPG